MIQALPAGLPQAFDIVYNGTLMIMIKDFSEGENEER
jgi:hypothetical protein